MCGSAVRARVRNGDATTGRRGTFHLSTSHVTPSIGPMGRIRPVAPGNGSELTCRRRSCALARSARFARSLVTMTIFRICTVERRRIF